MNKQRLVEEFMRKAGQYQGLDKPEIPTEESRRLRIELIREELIEFARASGYDITFSNTIHDTIRPDVIAIADALADLLYVVYGACVAWGIKIDPVFGAVHIANMDKFGPGSFAREDGKWIKPSGWEPPDIAAVLRAQGWTGGS